LVSHLPEQSNPEVHAQHGQHVQHGRRVIAFKAMMSKEMAISTPDAMPGRRAYCLFLTTVINIIIAITVFGVVLMREWTCLSGGDVVTRLRSTSSPSNESLTLVVPNTSEMNATVTPSWLFILVGGMRTYAITRNSHRTFIRGKHDTIIQGRYEASCELEIWGAKLAIYRDVVAYQLGVESAATKGHVYRGDKDMFVAYRDIWSQRRQAFELAKKYASEKRVSYKFVVFTRPDSVFGDFLDLDALASVLAKSKHPDRSIIAPSCCDFGGYCDRFAAGTWGAMEVYFENEDWLNEYNVSIPTLAQQYPDVEFGNVFEQNVKGHFYMRNLTRLDSLVSFATLRRASVKKYCANDVDWASNWSEDICYNKHAPLEKEHPPRPHCSGTVATNVALANMGNCSFHRALMDTETYLEGET